MSKSLRIIFAGTSDFAADHLEALFSSGHNVIAVFTQPDRPAGRGRKMMSSPVKVIAKKKEVPIFQPISLSSTKNQQTTYNLKADIMIVVAYGLILPKSILNIPRFGCINVHGSLLPLWRGAAPIQRSLWAGDKRTGITIIQMDVGLDNGNILYKVCCPIMEDDTSATLCKKLAKLGSKSLIKTLQQIVKNEINPEIQNESLVTYARKLSKDEARIDWSLPAIQLERCVRAFYPWPISWMKINGQIIKILQASAIQTLTNMEPGTILEANKYGIKIATTKGILNLESLQPAGRKPMNVQDFLNSRQKIFIPGFRLN